MSNDAHGPNADAAEPPADEAPGSVPGGVAGAPDASRERRPILERIGMAAVAVVMALLFGAVAAAAFIGGEYFLAAMGFVGCMMTLAVGGSTLLRG
jgi:hypothetical protein